MHQTQTVLDMLWIQSSPQHKKYIYIYLNNIMNTFQCFVLILLEHTWKISECMLIFKIIMGFNAGSILFYNTLLSKSAMSEQLMMVASFYGAILVKQKQYKFNRNCWVWLPNNILNRKLKYDKIWSLCVLLLSCIHIVQF